MDTTVVGVVGLLLVLVTVAVRVERDLRRRRTLGRFAAILDPQHRQLLEQLALHVAVHHEIVRKSTDEAWRLWREDAQAARVRLGLACDQIERVALPDLLDVLRVLRSLARSVQVLPPPRPLAVAAWCLLRTRGLAALVALLHWIGLTGRERVGVRLWFVKCAFVTAARVYRGTAARAVEQGFERPWYPTLDAAVSDMQNAHDETRHTAEQILDAFARWREYTARHAT